MDTLDDESIIPLTTEQRIGRAIAKLPTLSKDKIPLNDPCPICLLPFSSILEGTAQSMETAVLGGGTPDRVNLCGITKLEGCGHMFCRADLIEWIQGRHGTCPACRHAFLDVKPISDSDNESSDGDFIPDDEDEEEDDFEYAEREDDWFDSADEWDDEVDMDVDRDGFDRDEEDEVNADLWEGEASVGVGLNNPDIAVSYTGLTYIVDNEGLYILDDEFRRAEGSNENPSLGEPKH
ncbi:hypothetical protein NM688_g1436 [Phlebia brevispora]|uniref:Uncharacterized protein n=1 Tax=Phlebia brevispora TaxID=194682 RepID=A0ACC1TBJ5_9APHY|nr:hypothetical protein NM688_g1436 [Phlebia brevispora]